MTGNPEHCSVQGDADFVTHNAKEAEEKKHSGGMARSKSRDIELSSHTIVPHRRAGTLGSHTDVPKAFRLQTNQLPHCADTDTRPWHLCLEMPCVSIENN